MTRVRITRVFSALFERGRKGRRKQEVIKERKKSERKRGREKQGKNRNQNRRKKVKEKMKVLIGRREREK